MRTRERGAAGLFIAVLLILVIGGILATLSFLQSKSGGDRPAQEGQRFEKIKAALVQFVAANGRLPCPANAIANPEPGTENRTALSATCNSPTGTVPWASIGLRRDDAIDGWGWKISYRVYTGTAGSLTQDGGASMANCETNTGEAAGWSAGRTTVSGSAGGLCRGTRNTLESEFLVGKGLTITWFGTAVSDAAYVLVSHGPSGLGGFTSGSPAMQTSLPTNASELSNLNATGPFVATNATDATVAPNAANHFDDILAYQKITDLVRLAGVGARDWPDTALADVTITAAAVASATGSTPAAGSDLGVSSIAFETARVSGLTAGAARNLTFDTVGGNDGLGVEGSGTGISSALSEAIRIEMKNKGTKFAITLNNFQTVLGVWKERARFEFYNGTTLVSTFTPWQSCHGNAFTSFTFDLGATQFDRIDVTPLVSSADPFFGSTIATSFFLSAFKACTSTPCVTTLQAANPTFTCSGA
jgi:hypothetical protein